MPLTVKTGAMKVKDPSTGNYVDVDMSLGTDYAPLNSPALAGTPTAPTAVSSTNTTQIATTAYVKSLTGTNSLTTTAQTLNGAVNELDAEIGSASMGTTATTVKGAVAELNDVITHDTLRDTKISITSNPSSIDAIKGYNVGIYRVNVPNTNIFPARFGMLEVLKGSAYSIARFSTINSSKPVTWRVEWNNIDGSWYSSDWKDEISPVISEDTVANIISENTGYTITSAATRTCGNVVMLAIGFKATNAVSSDSSITIGTIVSGKRPAISAAVTARISTISYAYITSSGNVILQGTLAANTTYYISGTYLLP